MGRHVRCRPLLTLSGHPTTLTFLTVAPPMAPLQFPRRQLRRPLMSAAGVSEEGLAPLRNKRAARLAAGSISSAVAELSLITPSAGSPGRGCGQELGRGLL